MDLRKVKTLIDLVQQSGIAELEIQEGEERVRISRGPVGTLAQPQAYAAAPMMMPTSPATVEAAPAATSDTPPAEPAGNVLKSPMVGTFYRAASPGAKPFVEAGQTVKADTHVCIIEAKIGRAHV